jgi:hypothetical protein
MHWRLERLTESSRSGDGKILIRKASLPSFDSGMVLPVDQTVLAIDTKNG